MNRRQFLKLLPIPLLASCVNFNTLDDIQIKNMIRNYEERQRESLRYHSQKIAENKISFISDIEYEVNLDSTGNTFQKNGDGIRYNDYILTTNHLINQYMPANPYNKEPVKIKIIKRKVSLKNGSDLEVLVSDENNDIAVLKLPEGHGWQKYRPRLGDSDKIKPYDKVYIIGDPADADLIYREGIVSNEIKIR
ncbi:MAG: S1C family serine protease, partial [Nanoarchaeota archaeon]